MTRLQPSLWLALVCSLLLSACAPLLKPEGAEATRNELNALKADAVLAPQVQSALLDAELAVQAAELPTRDVAAGQHAVHVAGRKIDIARAEAERRLADEALRTLQQERQAILQDGQRREVEIAQAQAEAATAAVLEQQRAAQAALIEAANARAMTVELRAEMQELQARATDRGMVMTLGDVLFATGKSELEEGAQERLDKLALFMHRYIDRTLLIEGHTDAQGTDENNLLLSQRRAEAVKVYLIIQSVDSARLTAVGRGREAPVADNATPEGRQQNRRVEIIISNAGAAE